MKQLLVVHLSNIHKVSKAYYFRDRMLWFARDDGMRFDDRRLISLSHRNDSVRHTFSLEPHALESAVVEEASIMLLQILLSIVLQGDVVLPKWSCEFIPKIDSLFGLGKLFDLQTSVEVGAHVNNDQSAVNKTNGLCSLDHFIELTALNDVLLVAEMQQTNRSWNKIQEEERDMQLSYVENEILNVHKRSKLNVYTDKREDFTKKKLGWIADLWTTKLIVFDFSLQKIDGSLAANVMLDVTFPGQSLPSISLLVDDSKDRQKLDALISNIRHRRNHHIHLRGLTSLMTFQLFDGLWRYVSYFKNAQYAYAKISAAFDCRPGQRYHQMFPQYFNDILWEVQAAQYRCGVKGFR